MAACEHRLIVPEWGGTVVDCEKEAPHPDTKHHWTDGNYDVIWPDSFSATPEQLKELENSGEQ